MYSMEALIWKYEARGAVECKSLALKNKRCSEPSVRRLYRRHLPALRSANPAYFNRDTCVIKSFSVVGSSFPPANRARGGAIRADWTNLIYLSTSIEDTHFILL